MKAWMVTLVVVAIVELIAWQTGPVSAANAGARFYPPGAQPTYEQSIVQWQYDRARSPSLSDTDVLIIGDSSALMGIDPRVIEAGTGLRTESMALVAFAHVHGFADALNFFLQHQPAPRLVVLEMAPFGYAVPWSAYEEYGLRDAIADWAGAERPLWPSLSFRARTRAAMARISGFPGLDLPRGDRPSDDQVRDELQQRQGGMVETVPVVDWANERPVPARVQPEAIEALHRICALSQEHGFALLLLHNPVPEPLLTPTISGRLDAVATAFTEATEECERAWVIRPFDRTLPIDLFSTMDHLTEEGARTNSEAIAEVIDSLAARLGNRE